MNDYERTVDDVEYAISVTETAQCNAVDPEDDADLEEALEILRRVRDRAAVKS